VDAESRDTDTTEKRENDQVSYADFYDSGNHSDFYDFERSLKETFNILPEDEEEYIRWARERGLEVTEDDYDSYSLETIKALAKQGDIRALDILAESIRENDGNLEKAENIYIESAARGSLNAVDEIISIKYKKINSFNDSDAERAKKNAVEALAWIQIGKRRGQLDIAPDRLRNFDHYTQQLGIPLSLEDYKEADSLARQIYEDLQAKRNRLALGEFDNSIPTVFKKMGLDKE